MGSAQTGEIVGQASPAEAKVLLFRSLFRGRDDVYPRRFESRRTGKSGYQLACGPCVPGIGGSAVRGRGAGG